MDATVTELDPRDLAPPQRAANKTRLVEFIVADMAERSGLDKDTAIMFYDTDKDFVYAHESLPEDSAAREKVLAALAAKTRIRFWSKGV